MYLKKILIPVCMMIGITACNAQPMRIPEKPVIHWMSFEQAAAICPQSPKKIFIDTYTSWCGWCKKMEASTFQDTAVIRYMNDHYYAVKLDAETKDTIHFDGKIFVYKPENKANELAVALLNGKMSFPTTIYLDEDLNLINIVPGYMDPKTAEQILSFHATNSFKTTPWEEYQKNFKSTL